MDLATLGSILAQQGELRSRHWERGRNRWCRLRLQPSIGGRLIADADRIGNYGWWIRVIRVRYIETVWIVSVNSSSWWGSIKPAPAVRRILLRGATQGHPNSDPVCDSRDSMNFIPLDIVFCICAILFSTSFFLRLFFISSCYLCHLYTDISSCYLRILSLTLSNDGFSCRKSCSMTLVNL